MRPKILTKPIKLEDLKRFKEIDCYSDVEKDGVHYKRVRFTPVVYFEDGDGLHPISKIIIRESLENSKIQHVIEADEVRAREALELINSAILDGKVVKYFSAPKTMSGYRTRVKVNVRKMF